MKFIPVRLSKHRSYLRSRKGTHGTFNFYDDTTGDRAQAIKEFKQEVLKPFLILFCWLVAVLETSMTVYKKWRA